ncbi:hypothetical protein [Candidatus Protofrankia californiensis]|uniref:hypothetical protein n=1 Tax=Candidatus Protofrankia californiensis TaxID=1839754 RepID=UPI0013EB1D51|nr:hypothetical protein [Candidatus Protofrankia californiensis]
MAQQQLLDDRPGHLQFRLRPVPDTAPGRRVGDAGMLACAAFCTLPPLVGAGLLTAGAAAAVNQTLIAAAIALAILAVVFLG